MAGGLFELLGNFNWNEMAKYRTNGAIGALLDEYEKQRDLRWKSITTIDLLIEHAIVVIPRHRRQIEIFLLMLRN